MNIRLIQSISLPFFMLGSLLLVLAPQLFGGCNEMPRDDVVRCDVSAKSARNALESGCILGNDIRGIVVICLRDRSKHYLLRSHRHRALTRPVWSEKHQRLYCLDIDMASNSIQVVCKGLRDTETEHVYSLPQGVEVDNMIMLGDQLVIQYYTVGPKRWQSKVVAVDVTKKTSRVLFSNFFCIHQNMRKVNEREFLGVRILRVGNDHHYGIVQVNIDNPVPTVLFTLPDLCSYSPTLGGSTVFILPKANEFRLGDLATGKMKTLSIDGFPKRSVVRYPICSVGESHVLVRCQFDALAPLGTYAVNVSTAKASHLFKHRLDHMIYLANCIMD